MTDNFANKHLEIEINATEIRIDKMMAMIDLKFDILEQTINNYIDAYLSDIENYDIVGLLNNFQRLIDGWVADSTTIVNEYNIDTININDILTRVSEFDGLTDYLTTLISAGQSDDRVDLRDDVVHDKDDILLEGMDGFSTHQLMHKSGKDLLGVNALTDGKFIGMHVGFQQDPSFGRSLYVNLINTDNSQLGGDKHSLIEKIPFTRDYNPVRTYDENLQKSTSVVKIKRGNKVSSFDFGLVYMTKESTFSLIDPDDNASPIKYSESHLHVGGTVKRTYGNIIIEDIDGVISVKSIIMNNETDIDIEFTPNYKFNISYDDNHMYIYLETVNPPRNIYFDIESMNFNTGVSTETRKITELLVRDIAELMPKSKTISPSCDSLIGISDKYGSAGYGYDKFDDPSNADIMKVLTILRDTKNDVGLYSGMFIVPHYEVNLSLKDNSFNNDSTFEVYQYDRLDLASMDKTSFDIIPNGKAMVQLNSVPLTDTNKIKMTITDVSKGNTNKIFNTIYDAKENRYSMCKSLRNMIDENDAFILGSQLRHENVYFRTRVIIKSTISDTTNYTFDTTELPDYVFDIIGVVNTKGGSRPTFTYKVFGYDNNDTREVKESVDLIDSVKVLKERVSKGITYRQFSHVDGGIPVYTEFDELFEFTHDNFTKTTLSESVYPIRRLLDVVGEDDINAFIVVETEILSESFEFEDVNVSHLSIVDDDKYGFELFEGAREDKHPKLIQVDSVIDYKTI